MSQSAITCEACAGMLDDFRRDQLDERASNQVREHLNGCADCRGLLAQDERIGEWLRESAGAPAGNPDFRAMRAAVLREIENSRVRPMPDKSWTRPRQVLLAAAAALLLVLGLSWMVSGERGSFPARSRDSNREIASTAQRRSAENAVPAEEAHSAETAVAETVELVPEDAAPAPAAVAADQVPASAADTAPPSPGKRELGLSPPETGRLANGGNPVTLRDSAPDQTAAAASAKAFRYGAETSSRKVQEAPTDALNLRPSATATPDHTELEPRMSGQSSEMSASPSAPALASERTASRSRRPARPAAAAPPVQDALSEAESARRRGEWTRAVTLYEAAAAGLQDAKAAEARLRMADIYYDQLNDYGRAALEYERCLQPPLVSHFNPQVQTEIRTKLAQIERLRNVPAAGTDVP